MFSAIAGIYAPSGSAANRHRDRNRLPEVLQGQLKAAEIRMVVDRDLESQIELVAGLKSLRLGAFRHAPAHGFISEAILAIAAFLLHAQLVLLLFYLPGRNVKS